MPKQSEHEYQKHISFLKSKTDLDISIFELKLKVAKLQNNHSKVDELYKIMLLKLLKSMKFNFMIQNLPEYGTNSQNGNLELVTSKCIHDTLEQFGTVSNALVFKNNAYVWFKKNNKAQEIHKILNGMQINKNIIQTTYIC